MKFLDMLLGKFDRPVNPNKDVLLMVIIGNVYSWDGYKARRAGGSGFTNCIAENKNEIFEGTIGGVCKFTTLDNKYIGETVAEGRSVMAMCSHEGVLFDATPGSPDDESDEIYETLADKVVAKRESRIRALASHDGVLYDGGWYGVCETFSGKKVSNEMCEELCSQGGNLYSASSIRVLDVLSGKEVAQSRNFWPVHGMCQYNYTLVDAVQDKGIRDTMEDEIILPFEELTAARGKRDQVLNVPDMTSVNGLAYIAATRGKQAAFDVIEAQYKDQLSFTTVRNILAGANAAPDGVVNYIEQGVEVYPEQMLFLPNLMAEFSLDDQLAIAHGKGKRHSLIRSDALKKVTAHNHHISDYASLVKAFFEEGYHVKRVDYVSFESRHR